MQHEWDEIGAKLSNSLHYQMVSIVTQVLAGNFLFLPLYLWLHNYSEA
jgi:hypothetical protein